MRTIILKLAPLLIFLSWSGILRSQTVTTTVGLITNCPGEVTIPVEVTGFTSVGAFSMALNLNPSVLSYAGYQNLNPALDAETFVANGENGTIYLSWYGSAAATLANGSILVELKFMGSSGSTTLNWDTQTSGYCEYTDMDGQVLPSTWINGNATIDQPPLVSVDPTDKFIYTGSNTTFTVTAYGAGLAYLWQVSADGGTSWTDLSNNEFYSNVTYATLYIFNTPLNFSGLLYRCKISGTCSPMAFSNSALLTVTPYINTTCQSVVHCPGEIVVPVNVTDFIGVGSFSMALNINSPNLAYTGYQNLNPGLPAENFTINTSGGTIYLSWFGTSGVTLPNGSLLELKFTGVPGTGSLAWDVQTPGYCEYTDNNGVVFFSNWVNGNITINQPPLITAHPDNKIICNGNNATYAVTATGADLSYLWQVSTNGGSSWFDLSNEGHYSNVTTPALNINEVPLDWSGNLYRCRVTGACMPVAYSNPALLTVTPLIITTCQSVTSCPGEVVVPVTVADFIGVGAFSMALSYHSSILTYNGYQNFNATLTSGNYSVNASGDSIYISWYNTSAATLANDAVLIELKFTGAPGPGILAWDTQTPGNCEYSDVNGLIIFSSWVDGNITINQPPLITSNPANKTIYAGSNTTFSLSATGTGLNYQWQVSTNNGSTWSDLVNGMPYSGVTTTVLAIDPVAPPMNGYLYRGYVTGTCAPYVYSGPAMLTVTQAAITTSISDIPNSCTGNLNVPVNVTNCTNVGSISLALQFDPEKMSFEGYHTINSELLSGILAINQSANMVYLSWTSTDPADIGTGTLAVFSFKANPGISATLNWDTQTPGNCEYSDINGMAIVSFYTHATLSVITNALMVNAGNDATINPGNTVQLNGSATGGIGPYSYLWSPSTWLNDPTLPNPQATPLSSITYTLTTTGSDNCVGSDAMQITILNNLPQVTTASISEITFSSALGGGTVINDGGAPVTSRGVCWNVTGSPTVNDNHTDDGSGTGAYTSGITGLTGSTTYHVRAYAANSVGAAYGDQVGFTTLATPVNLPPTINPVPNPAPIAEDAGQQTINLSGISDGNPEFIQNISISATSSNLSVIPNPIVNYTPNNPDGSLNYTPALHAFGNSVITVTVTDDGGTANGGVNTITISFNIVVLPINDPPIANAGPDQSATPGSIVVLDGSGSYDIDGDPLFYSWSTPSGIILSDYTAIHPTFTAPPACIIKRYVFGLTVNDGTVNSSADSVSVTVSAALPLIHVRPVNLADTLISGNASVQEITIKNKGFCNLTVALTDPVSWLTKTPDSGLVLPGDSLTVSVHFNATDLFAGFYDTEITINSNDPNEPLLHIPITLLVTGEPLLALSEKMLNFGYVPAGQTTTQTLTVSNTGTDSLHVFNVLSNEPQYTVDFSTFVIPPQNSRNLVIAFMPTSNDPVAGLLTIHSDNPGQSMDTVQMIGNGCISPAPTITGPSSICGIPSTGNVYFTEAGMSGYFWNVSAGGLITAGIGTNTITVTWTTSGEKTVAVNYINNDGCFAANPTSYPVHVYVLPIPTITGPSPICDIPSTGNVYYTEPDMSGYSWTVSAGGTITSGAGTNAITITWDTFGEQSVGIIYSDNNGCTAANPTVKTIPVNELLPVSIIIDASANPTCSGKEVTFTATPLNGGTAPFYQWKINGLYVGVNSATYGYIPINNDVVTCTLTSNLSCTTGNPATSNPVIMTVNVTPAAPASGGNQNVCSTELPATLSATAPGGSAVDWYNAPVGGSLLLANSDTYSVSTTGTYYAESRNTTTGCASAVRTAITLTINQAIQYFADADGDGFGNSSVSVFACSQPAGYVADNTDCNDSNPDINPGDQYFAYSGNVGFTSSIIAPEIGSSYTLFHFESDYYDATNTLPMASYPRLILDYEGNGSYTDPNDRILVMTPFDLSDNNTVDGKRYIVNANGLPYGTTWKAQLIVSDGNICTTTFGPFDYPDVMQQPNISIFANDITFSNPHPDPSQNITVSAVIHNESDFDAQNFQVHLINQYDTSLIYPDVAVTSIPPHGSATVQWDIITPSVPAWCPMQVIADYTHVIDETNELDNTAVRPFVNGNFQVAGSIVCASSVSPSVSYSNPDNFLLLSGSAFYSGLAVPLPDSSVAGATVSFQVTETGATFSGYTNSSGYFNIYFLAPVTGGSYHITGTITDYTLTGVFSSQFTIISKPNLNLLYCQSVNVRPVNPQYPGTATLVANVTNNGNDIAAGPIHVSFSYSSGAVFTGQYNGDLNPGQSVEVTTAAPLPPPATTLLTAFVDPLNLIAESNESDNSITDNMCWDFQPVPFDYGCGSNFWSNSYQVNQSITLSVGLDVFHLYDANPVKVKFEVSGPGISGGQNLGNVTVNNVSQNCYYCPYMVVLPSPFTFPGLGVYTFTMTADPDNEYAECNENNNVLVVTVNVVPPPVHKPNLTYISCHSLDISPVNPQYPGDATLIANVSNNGDLIATGPIQVAFSYSSGETFSGQYNGNLNPGQSVEITASAPLPPPATAVLTASVDPLNQIDEANESDNITFDDMCWEFQPVAHCGANFWSRRYVVNQSATLAVGLAVSHLYDANPLKVKFEVSGPGITGTLNLGNAILNNVARNCYCPHVAVLPTPFTFFDVGVYTFTMTADPDNNYAECNENNNVLVVTVEVTGFPDMRILSQYINPSGLNPELNQPVSLLVTYDNVGLTNVNDVMKLKVLVDNIPLDSVYPVSGLANGDHATVAIPALWSGNIPGSHIIRAFIDSDNQVVENDEANNDATRAIVVGQAANLYFQAFTPSNSNPNLNDQINILARIGNNGQQGCNAILQLYYINDLSDTISIGQTSISIPGYDSVSVDMTWSVADNSTTVIGKVVNTSAHVLEFNYDDNEAFAVIGGFTVSFTSTPGCNSGNNGTLTATANGGVAPYLFIWDNGFVGQTLTAGVGNHTVTVTDNTGLSIIAYGIITAYPFVEPAISGPSDPCVHSTNNTYTTEAGMTGYLWNVSSGGTITAGTGTNAITATWDSVGNQTVTVNYTNENGCNAITPSVKNVNVNPDFPVSVSITSNPLSPVNAGTLVAFTAVPTNGGSNPFFQWEVNGNGTGTNSPVFAYVPANGDVVLCSLTSSLTTCTSNNPALSNEIIITVLPSIAPCPGIPTVVYGGQTYNTVQIGDQCWFRENLNIGTRIDGALDQSNNIILEKYCYDNMESNCDIYGGLYQWNEVMQYETTEGAQGICPTGWHVPTDGEWTILSDFLGGEPIAGGKLKEAGTAHWNSPNLGGSNESGFTALAGGGRYNSGNFGYLPEYAFFWSSSQYDATDSRDRLLYYNNEVFFNGFYNRAYGLSLRCLKDTVPPSFIQLLFPNGGETLLGETLRTITWSGATVTNVKIEFSANNGSTWNTIASSVPAGSGSYPWTVPNTPSTVCLIRISNVDNPAQSDISDAVFTILNRFSHAPVTYTDSIGVNYNSPLSAPVKVDHFRKITAISLRMDYDPTTLTYVGTANQNSLLPGIFVNKTNISPSLSRIMISWSDANPVSLSDGSKIIDLLFTYISGSAGLVWNNTSNNGSDCEYADSTGNPLPDLPTSLFYRNGVVYYRPGWQFNGSFTYNNADSTPLGNLKIVLLQNSTRVDSVTTNTAGNFQFSNVGNGAYVVKAYSGEPLGGVNSTDAIKIQRHFTMLELLSEPVRLLAADVNMSNAINATDAVKVKRRFAMLDNSFARGDWVFAKTATGGDTIMVSGANLTQNFYGLCVGDVNGSNIPDAGDWMPQRVEMTTLGTIEVSPGQTFELPVKVTSDMMIGAVSLVIPYPLELLEALDVTMEQGPPLFNISNGAIRIAWSDLQALNLIAGETLLTLRLRAKESFTGDQYIELLPTNESEMADNIGKPIPLAGLSCLVIKSLKPNGISEPGGEINALKVYPNPAQDVVFVEATLNSSAGCELKMMDGTGREVKIIPARSVEKGTVRLRIDIADLPNGLYSLKISFSSENGQKQFLNKVIINR